MNRDHPLNFAAMSLGASAKMLATLRHYIALAMQPKPMRLSLGGADAVVMVKGGGR
jgi:hypothetical protein